MSKGYGMGVLEPGKEYQEKNRLKKVIQFIICFGKQENGGKGWDIKSAYPVPKNYYPVLITSI